MVPVMKEGGEGKDSVWYGSKITGDDYEQNEPHISLCFRTVRSGIFSSAFPVF